MTLKCVVLGIDRSVCVLCVWCACVLCVCVVRVRCVCV